MRSLVATVLVVTIAVAVPVLAQQHAHMVVSPDMLTWVEPPVLPGARLAVVQGDPSKDGPFTYRIKMPAGYKVPPHFHKAGENVTVLSGVFWMGLGEKFDQGSGQELSAGGFFAVPPKHPHYAWAGNQETIVQVHGVGPTDLTFVNPADDPRRK
ncbi:MAG TPA: cupin domain-containing protein [Methylomirabilota bacterium]